MFLAKKLLSAWLLPPMGLVVLGIAGLTLLVLKRTRRGVGCIFLSLSGFGVLSLPITAYWLMSSVETYSPVQLNQLGQEGAIVILGGGLHRGAKEFGQKETVSQATLARLRYGAWLARRTHLPVLVTGGAVFGSRAEAPVMAEVLREDYGVRAKWIEADSKDTRDNATFSAQLLRRAGIRRIVLVSNAYHLRRAVALFESEGLEVTPAPTLTASQPEGIQAWLPSPNDLAESCIALREWLGWTMNRIGSLLK